MKCCKFPISPAYINIRVSGVTDVEDEFLKDNKQLAVSIKPLALLTAC
jgi:hypothetical protein